MRRLFSLVLILAMTLSICTGAAVAQSDEEMEIMLLFYSADELVVSATRSLKPINKVAENITMLTHRELEAANAHTLLDVLKYVTGVQADLKGGPGVLGKVYIQGSNYEHVLVLVDDVPMNNLSDNIADIAAIPAQHIERIEIIKGPASSAWGSSLGGVINIITKSPTEEKKATVFASRGDGHTNDVRFDLSAKDGKVGYYVYGGVLESEGLTGNRDVDVRTIYTKLELDVTEESKFYGTYNYSGGRRGDGIFEDYDFASDIEHKYEFFTLGYKTKLPMDGSFDISYRNSRQELDVFDKILSLNLVFETSYLDELEGGSVKLVLQPEGHVITLGGDYDYATLTADNIEDGKQSIEKRAVYLNDSVTMGPVTVTPGVRYDDSDAYGDFTSPSLGIAYSATDGTILRVAAARGFNAPSMYSLYGAPTPFYEPNPDLEVEKVWSYQAGVETTDIPNIWFKATLFQHDIEDGITDKYISGVTRTVVNKDEIRREGYEVELVTEPVFHTSLLLGYTYIDIKDMKEDEEIKNVPRKTADAGLQFEAGGYRAMLRGHYIDWNAEDFYESEDDVICDLFLSKQFGGRDSGEVFFAVHNIFNGDQYFISLIPNPERWIEGGVRFRF